MNIQYPHRGRPWRFMLRAAAMAGFVLPITAFAHLGGFEINDGYAGPVPRLVNGYNAGGYGLNNGGPGGAAVSTLPTYDLGLWNDLNNYYGSYGISIAAANPYGYYVTQHAAIPGFGMFTHSGTNMLAMRNVGRYPLYPRPLDFRYSLDTRDFYNGGSPVAPLATAASEVKWSIWTAPGPVDPNAAADGFHWTFRDSNGNIGLQLGWDSTFHVRYRALPTDPWVTLPELVGRPWRALQYGSLVNGIYDRFDVTFNMLTDTWSLSVYDTQSATLTDYAIDLPFGHRLDNLTSIDFHLTHGMDKMFFDDSSFIVSDAVAPFPGFTYTIGYWKTHPEAWPVDTLFVGGVSYSAADALAILNTPPPKGDATYILIQQLIAAKLSVLAYADDTALGSTIEDADAFLAAHPLGSQLTKLERSVAIELAAFLADFNNGLLPGAPHAP